MANDINTSTVTGRLTRDAELKYTNSGSAVTTFSIASNYSKKEGDQWVEEVNYFDVTAWGRQGEALNQYLQKGQEIAVTGELRQDRWEKDGQKRSKVGIKANSIKLLGGKSNGGQSNNNQGSNNQSNNSYQKPQQNNQGSGGNGNFEDDIPF